MKKFIDKYLISYINFEEVEKEMKSRWGEAWKDEYSYGGMKEIISQSHKSIALHCSKGIYIPGQIYLGIFNPSYFLFDRRNIYILGLKMETYKDLFGYYPNVEDEFPPEVYIKMEEILMSQHYWGFWLPSEWRPRKKNRIIPKEFEIQEIQVLPEKIKVSLREVNGKGNPAHPEEYKLFPSVELQDEYRRELEESWLFSYDTTMEFFDRRIRYLENQVKRFKYEKKMFAGSYEEYRNRIKKQIWNN